MSEDIALADLLAVADVQEGTDHNVVVFEFLALVVDDLDRASFVQGNIAALGRLHESQTFIFDDACRTDADLRGLEPAGRDAADMERSHRELRSWLANRLRGNNADRIANLCNAASCRIDAV